MAGTLGVSALVDKTVNRILHKIGMVCCSPGVFLPQSTFNHAAWNVRSCVHPHQNTQGGFVPVDWNCAEHPDCRRPQLKKNDES